MALNRLLPEKLERFIGEIEVYLLKKYHYDDEYEAQTGPGFWDAVLVYARKERDLRKLSWLHWDYTPPEEPEERRTLNLGN